MRYPKEINEFLREFEPPPYAVDEEGLKKLKTNLQYAEEKAVYWREQVIKHKSVIQTVCAHANKSVDTQYFEGGYLDRASTDYKVRCTDCGATLFEHTATHSYYG